MSPSEERTRRPAPSDAPPTAPSYWRVDGLVWNFSASREVVSFAWNSPTFQASCARAAGVAFVALASPFLGAASRVFASRLRHVWLRGLTRDRLELLGEEYFHRHLQPRLDPAAVAEVRVRAGAGQPIVLVSRALDHDLLPLAEHLGVQRILANRLEFRNGACT
ncbi:MAG: HAD family hydrolase, partial [Planctomycetota bacterium]